MCWSPTMLCVHWWDWTEIAKQLWNFARKKEVLPMAAAARHLMTTGGGSQPG